MNKLIAFLGLFLWLGQIHAQTEIKLMSYNLLHFPTGTTYDRTADLRYILDTYQPDIFMVCELESETGSDMVLNDCLNYSTDKYNGASFIENNSSTYRDLQQMLYYNKQMFELTYQTLLMTSVRDINHYTLKLRTTNQNTNPIYLEIYVAHLKASSGSDNEQTRYNMVTEFTDDLQNIPAGHYVIFAGDFNLYSASEPAYQEIIDNTNAIVMHDPSNSPGSWHNNYDFRALHTQATHSQSNNIFVGGGIDDRFDFIMLSENMFNNSELQYIDNTYQSYGNNGNCFNKAITNSDCDSADYDFTLRTHLYNMSDHLPVSLKLETDQDINLDIENYEWANDYRVVPNPVRNSLSISGKENEILQIQIFNSTGQMIYSAPDYRTFTKLNMDFLDSGVYFIRIQEKNHSQTLKFVKTD